MMANPSADVRVAQEQCGRVQRRRGAPQRQYLRVISAGKINWVPFVDVIYLRAEHQYVTLHTAMHRYLINDTLNALAIEYGSRLVRVSRSVLVALEYITGLRRLGGFARSPWVVLLRDSSDRLLISRREQGSVFRILRAERP